MFDLFGINNLKKENEERRKKLDGLRNEMFDVVGKSNEFCFKLLDKENSAEYWKWRLDFDKLRYNIK